MRRPAVHKGLRRAEWRALGTSVRLVVRAGDQEAARIAVTRVLDDVDRACSRFRPDSELAIVNRAGGAPTTIGPLFERAVRGALRAARWTGGAVDPTVGGALRAIGYDRDFELLDDRSTDAEVAIRLERVPGTEAIELDETNHRLRLRTGTELDLGSTGKGLAADLAAAAALEAAGPAAGVLVSLGGDIAVSGMAPRGGWQIHVADDSAARTVGPDDDVVAIWNGAIATSSTIVRTWAAGGTSRHHIVDPRTGVSAVTPWRTASVAASTCEIANAASTAAIVMGQAAEAWLERTGLAARLVRLDGTVVRLGAWPRPLPADREHAALAAHV